MVALRSEVCIVAVCVAVSVPVAGFAGQAPAVSQSAARELTSGEEIFHRGCAGCHGPNGEGAPQTSIGFDRPSTFPDFTDCAGTTPELDVDWRATITEGGYGRGFSRIMPSFAEELTPAQIDAVIGHLRTLCRDRRYPRGELNFPRPLRTEKAFPESETVLTTGVGTGQASDVESELAYEHRLTARDQLEIAVPYNSVHDESGTRVSGVGDVALGWKRVLFASHNTILSGQGEIVFPVGNSDKGLGSGTTTFGVFASAGQILPANTFAMFQVGTDQPASTDKAPRTLFWRAAAGWSARQQNGLGRLWTPMLEVVSDREFVEGARANIDLVPQFQVTLNRRQHVRANIGVQLPATNTIGRPKQVVFYLLWDWFDGGLLEGWK
jgi:mono/diheme cytochrome c family protein